MNRFEKKFFQPIRFTPAQIERAWQNAKRDLKIAKTDKYTEVRFLYAYQALLKVGIALLAKEGGVKVRSVQGHHIQILKKLSEIMGDPSIFTIGNIMRQKRNLDVYSGGQFISRKEANDYVSFVSAVFHKLDQKFSKSSTPFNH